MLSGLMMLGATLGAVAGAPIATTTFPETLHGQWTDNLSNCGGEDTRGMIVRAQNIQFYETSGTPQSVRIDKNGTITAELIYRGEGKTWAESNNYLISKDRKSVRVNGLGHRFVLHRCP
jgi:hypothetical protein